MILYSGYSQYSRILGQIWMPSVSLNPRIPNTTNTNFIHGIHSIREFGENIEKSIKTVFAVFSIRGLGEDHALQTTPINSEYGEYSEYKQSRPQPQRKTVYASFSCKECGKSFVAPENKILNVAKCRTCGNDGQRVYSDSEFERLWGWIHATYTGGKDGRWIPTGTPEERELRRKRFPGFFK